MCPFFTIIIYSNISHLDHLLLNVWANSYQDLDFQCHMSWSYFVLSKSSWELIVCFIDIGEIDGHHCLNVHFKILYKIPHFLLIWQKACLLWAVLVSEWLKLKGYFLLKLQVKLFCFGTNKILSSSQKILG